MAEPNEHTPDRKTLTTWSIAALITLMFTFMSIQWQQAIDESAQNAKEVTELEQRHREDVARLDESNRNRRNSIADLEERIAILEERTSG